MRCYIEPTDTLTMEDIIASISRQPQKEMLLEYGDFNADLA